MTKGHETKPKISFGLISHFARVHGFEKKRAKRKRRKKKEEEKSKD